MSVDFGPPQIERFKIKAGSKLCKNVPFFTLFRCATSTQSAKVVRVISTPLRANSCVLILAALDPADGVRCPFREPREPKGRGRRVLFQSPAEASVLALDFDPSRSCNRRQGVLPRLGSFLAKRGAPTSCDLPFQSQAAQPCPRRHH